MKINNIKSISIRLIATISAIMIFALIGAMPVQAANDVSGNEVSKARACHCRGDGEGTGDSDKDIPGEELCIFLGREHMGPSHDDDRDADKEEHIQLQGRHVFFDEVGLGQ